ncbi:hypothetical protein KP509_32G070000 [Ceratopteris richardii]|nr:hypothetical protein KP509_32G070000 [Ceratopteris richardii]KAH7287703.1 hypothetical protein KP509_32G070000 [Ceratopteris richardii]KAH7287704.1 hypothetical protein KP509_32G070000 [Ceratopteris richardii]KAH7287705.1 hypothetical protein KP509_32G070000 [Ceratopteris richardii]
MICISAALYCLGAIVMFWSPNVYVLLVARILDGVGVGLAVTVAPLYISEISPAEIRGELNTLPQLLGTSGMFLAYCLVFGLSLISNPSWRMMLGIIFIPSVFYLLIGLLFLPESPRWLVSKGRTKEAKQVLQRLRSREDVSGEMALLVEGLGVGEDLTLEEYIIQPAGFMGDNASVVDNEDDTHIRLFAPEDGTEWIAKPLSSITGSQGFLSRPPSIFQQGTPRLGSMSLMDPMVTLMGSFKGTVADHQNIFGSMYSPVQNHQFEAFTDEKDDEENVQRHTEVSGYFSEDADGDGALTSPLLSRHSSSHWEDPDLHRLDSLASSASRMVSKYGKDVSAQTVPTSIAPQHGSFVGSVGSAGIGGGWQLVWQLPGPEDTEDIPHQGSYKRIFLFQEPPADGTRAGSTYSLPRFGSTVGEVESIPAAALVSRPSKYGKDIHLDNQVGPALIHPAEIATKGPVWSDLLHGGVKQALIVGVVLQILEQFGGINAVLNFTPKILQESGADVLLSQMGIGSDSASILASAVTQLVALPFIVVAMRLMDVIGRRRILLTTLPILVIALLCLIIINIVPASDAVFASVSVLSVVVYVIFFVTGFGPIPNMLCAEIFPTRVRGVCTGICQAAMWITNILVTELFPILDASLGIAKTFAFFAVFCFIAWIFVYVKVPETKGMPLEVIVEFFAMSAAEKKRLSDDQKNAEKETEV